MAKRKKGARRYFIVMSSKGGDVKEGVFSGRSPRQAALKVANRGATYFELRERGTKKVHIFKGTRTKIIAPEEKPDWMPSQVWKPNVEKVGIEKLERIRR